MKIKDYWKKIGAQDYFLEIHYNKERSFFFVKKLPSDFETYSESWRLEKAFSSENVLITKLEEAVIEYVKNKTSSRKVIAFTAVASSDIIMNKVDIGDNTNASVSRATHSGFKHPNYKKLSEVNGTNKAYMLGFSFYVMTEQDNAGIKEYFNHQLTNDFIETGHIDKYPKPFGNVNLTVIPYTEEALNFFVSLSISFSQMTEKIAMFFGEENESKQLEFILNKKLLS